MENDITGQTLAFVGDVQKALASTFDRNMGCRINLYDQRCPSGGDTGL